jgi:DNA-binding NarL/FixJ family response regulator
MTDVRILIADDHPIVRSGLSALIGSISGYTVVAVASDGAAAVREAVVHKPDVAIVDIEMPGMGGIEATRKMLAAVPSLAVLVLTLHDDADTLQAAMRVGARGYLVKGAEQDEIVRAIDAVAAGQMIFGAAMTERLQEFAVASTGASDPFPGLTQREREIIALLADGLSNAGIAIRLGLAPKTIANNVSAIFLKLNVSTRAEAIVRAREAGLGRTT